MTSPTVHADPGRARSWGVLHVQGELDCVQAEALRATLDHTLLRHRNVALHLGEVPFCDSYGLSVLVYGAKKARERGGELWLPTVSRQVRSLIERTGLDRLLTLPER
ncbi:STAS domain-containing protein [Actinomadura hibisca]|uniref:STAS domain-containing protein n=1 Tax=Actinomadura hibisca TaxID=68565 RepID=UPI000831425C|nr:STAS domain-containing protein [Actinomadura hibisca]